MKRFLKSVMILSVAAIMCTNTVYAATSSEIKKQKEQTESKLNSIKQNINSLEQKKSSITSQISEKNNELVDLLVVIDVLEDDMATKEAEIAQAQADYDAAKAKEEEQYQAMKKRIQYMYENGNTMYIEALLEAESISDMLNKAEFVSEIYDYDRNLLTEYQATKEEVANLQAQLEQEKDEMVALEADYKEQQGNLEVAIANMKEKAADFASELSKAKAQAKSYQETIAAQAAQIKQLAAEEQKKADAAKKAEEAAKKKSETQTASTSNTKSDATANTAPSTGGGSGGSIASFACQFVGNPYVSGGTSLTNGADCSGFTQAVFAHFGISIPRTSGSQLGGGTPVSFSDIQPGDIVCYAGHVALYIGNGQIVHASTPATGIKYGNVTYRTILGVRRYY